MDVGSRSAIALSSVLAVLLALVAGPAAALGLGQLEVKSRPGQPLVAEIPIISNDPSELQGLQVQLAPPETFTRVGLEPPAAGVASLRFEPTVDNAGRPVIRVTSAQPVPAPLLTFLLQVDWSEGRLVREYSALLDTPNTVAATVQPVIEAPIAAPGNRIPSAPVVVQPPPPPPQPTPLQRTPVTPVPVQPAPVAAAAVATPSPAPELAATPESIAPSSASPDRTAPVRAGQTLGQIVKELQLPGGHSAAQAMLAVLRDNPGAFIGGNVNLLRQGAVLRIPDAASLASIDRPAAAAAIHEQIVQWRALQVPRAQLVASSTSSVDAPQAPAKPRADQPARTLGARLEIAPSSAAGRRRAGTQSGIEAGGEGEMLRQQLQETTETLAARDAEVTELKTRVAELEKLQQQQQQLLTMKDSALAAAQQTLAKSNQAASAPVATQAPAQPAPPAAAGSGGIWLWSGLALVVVALVGWLLTRRKASTPPRRAFDTAALAAGIPVARPAVAEADPLEPEPDFMTDPLVSAPTSAASMRRPDAAIVPPPWHGGSAGTATVEPSTQLTVNQQLEAARTCLAQGDDAAARVLLREVMDGRDPAAREVAARLMRDL